MDFIHDLMQIITDVTKEMWDIYGGEQLTKLHFANQFVNVMVTTSQSSFCNGLQQNLEHMLLNIFILQSHFPL